MHPVWGATKVSAKPFVVKLFQSTHPSRGATALAGIPRWSLSNFNPRTPRGVRRYIRSFELPEEEELYLIECDVRKKSVVQASLDHHSTPDVVKRRRQAAYAHIADAINN